MKVILLQNVPSLGKMDDVKDVSDGYAVNFLFPKHLAVQASPKAMADLTAHKKKLAKDEERDLREQQSLAALLDGVELKFVEKANDKGLLYSAVSAQKIADAFKKRKQNIDKKQIEVPNIKKVGEYIGKIKFRHGLEASFNVIVSQD